MRRISSVFAIILFASLALAAQQRSAEDQAVRKTIEDHYFKAQSTGNGDALKGTFIEEGRMMWVQDGQLRMRTSTEYIGGFRGQPPADESQRKRRVVMTDVTGNVAIAKVELDFPDALLTDYFTLLKMGNEWKIVHKSFHRRMK
jgi:Putative lumazine-binding